MSWTVHPRLRGELSSGVGSGIASSGSSPLTRGTLSPKLETGGTCRFIPAYAGNSGRTAQEMTWELGSSPLTRGTHKRISATDSHCRFIPAYAGNSEGKRILRLSILVHPRLRGELNWMPKSLALMRWFIPAYAGNSRKKRQELQLEPVHPRLRGELT